MLEVNWVSPICSPSGYANVNRRLVVALHKLGVQVNLINQKTWDVLTINDYQQDEKEILEKCFKNKVNPKVPTVYYTTPHNYSQLKVKNSVYDICGSMFEVDRIPKSWVDISEQVDEMWIPSIFNLETYYNSGVDIEKLHVLPLGVDTNFFRPCEPTYKITNKRKFTFISAFQWTYRKGFDVLIKAFIEEFKKQEDVCLIIKTYHATAQEEHNNIIRKDIQQLVSGKDHAPILTYFGILSPEQILSFYNSGDCFVLPTRGEGWSLPAIEAMSCEVPIITTNWSAHKMFLNENNSSLIDYDMVDCDSSKMAWIFDGYKGTKCAEPRKEHLKELMRHVYNNHAEVSQKSYLGRQDLIKNFTWEHAAKRIIKRLGEIQCMI